ncbi:peptidoglycan editing factor PgeF [Marinicauda algicola]|uniref:peptidoglycan editing factor PgeF n=1 Tax=Marinicauda algicola TaxID=2029849 RepID=UPI001F12BBE0|nr:peptidoglycan editing factor PgeF [Marinicauda algicola]
MKDLASSEPEFLRPSPLAGAVRVFTTRTGGVSEGPYESLNLTWSRGDDKAAVEENRRRVTQALGLDRLVFANQVHGRTVLRVDAAPEGAWSAGEGDALITDVPGLGLCAQTADCVPLLLFDPVGRAAGAVHSGWRGTVANITAATVQAMGEAYGTRPRDLHAAIGPAIGKENYRVGPEVLEQFEALFGELDERLATQRDGKGGAGLDVGEAVRRQLLACGLLPENIERIAGCTYAERERFFSSRRAAAQGHPGAFGGQCGVVAVAR